jgi:hypothetical protein
VREIGEDQLASTSITFMYREMIVDAARSHTWNRFFLMPSSIILREMCVTYGCVLVLSGNYIPSSAIVLLY